MIHKGLYMIVAFCGHADYVSSSKDKARVLDFLESTIKSDGVEFFLGGYGFFDQFALECAKAYRARHPNATLALITPYMQTERQDLCEYDTILYPALEHVPPRYAISHRNRWIVDQADLIVAYVTRSYGGAYTTYRYALRKNKEIFHLTD